MNKAPYFHRHVEFVPFVLTLSLNASQSDKNNTYFNIKKYINRLFFGHNMSAQMY